MVYRSEMDAGIVIDVNSFYPAVMMNKMPVHYNRWGADTSVVTYDQIRVLTRDNYKWVKHCDIYYIKFRFPADCKIPTIVVKTDQTLVAPLESVDFDVDAHPEINGTWVFGETIRTAIECGNAVIKVFKTIEFTEDYIHKDYVEYFYQKRLDAKAQKDAVGDQFYKLMMNSLFGKHGQKLFKKVVFGGWHYIKDWYDSLVMRGIIDIEINRVLTDMVPIYELKYSQQNDHLNHKGATKRFSQFIMEVARASLMRIKYAIADAIGWESISYCDTDSVFIAIDKIDPQLSMCVQQIYSTYMNGKK